MPDSFNIDRDLPRLIARRFHGILGAIVLAAAAILWAVRHTEVEALFFDGLPVVLALTVALALAAYFVAQGRLQRGIGVSLLAIAVAAMWLALATGRGLQSVVIGVVALVVLVAAVVLGRRPAMLFAGGAAAALLLMFFFAPGTRPSMPPVVVLLVHLLLLGLGLLFGTMIERIVASGRSASAAQQRRLRTLLRIASDWYWEQDAQHRFVRVDAWKLPPGTLAEDSVLGRTRWELPNDETPAEKWDEHRAVLRARQPFRDFIVSVRAADGSPAYLSISGEPVFDADGNFTGYWGVGRDVTQEVGAQRALEASERRYRDLFERTPSPLLIHRGGVVIVANGAAAAQFGCADAAAMAGADVLNLHPEQEHAQVRRRVAELEAMPLGGELAGAELLVYGPGREIRLVMASGVRVPLADGPATLSIYFDITDRKRAEAALRQSQEMLSRLFEASPDAMVVADIDTGLIVLANEHFYSMLGLARDEAAGRTALELGVWDDPAQRRLLVEALGRGRAVRNLPVMLRARDGRRLPAMVSSARLELAGRRYMVSIVRDVTTRERTRLQQQAILNNASIGIAFTRNQVFQLVNPRFEEMFGWAPGTLQGQPGRVVWRSDEDYREVGRLVGPLLSQGEPVDLERPMRRQDGTDFWCRIRARAVDPKQPATGGTIWIAEDVTERHAFEQALAAAKEGAEAASRAKSAFLANMSHEIRTPLNALLGLARLALAADSDAARSRLCLQRLIESAEALAALISDTLDLSKIEAGKLTIETVDFDLHELIDSACAAYREVAADKGLLLETQVAAEIPRRLLGDPLRIRQIVGNFVSNAVKFTEEGRIDVAVRRLDDGKIRLSVTDTGIGIDEATRGRLFEPFSQGDQSITRRFGGTGLGLSICRSLAALMGGEVGFESRPGVGSTFWADLPLAEAAPQPAPAPAADDRPLAGLRVLLVEDNAVNMLIAEQLLVHWGAEVVQAANGRQAVEAVERAGGDFDVVLMDVHMPDMDGHEATAALRQRYSKEALPIVALTAAALLGERETSLAAGMNDFIGKPIEAQRMVDVVLRVTASRRAALARAA